MKQRLTVFGLVFVALAAIIYAQAVTGASRWAWEQPADTLADAQAFAYKYFADGSTTGVALTDVTCTGSASPFTCRVAIPAFTPGSHTVVVTATNVAGESGRSNTLTFKFFVPPGTPQNLRSE